MAKKIYYKIGEACKHLDIQPYVLRYWETEFPMLRPEKSSSGQRVYSARDLATIRRIKELLYDEGYTIAGAKKKLDTEDLSALSVEPAAKPAAKPEAKDEPGAKAPRSEPEPKKAPAKKASAKKSAKKKGAAAKTKSDGASAKDVAALRKGIEAALENARDILQLLDSKSAKR